MADDTYRIETIDGSYRQVVYVRHGRDGEDEMVLGTVADLAKEAQDAEYADYQVNEVFGLDQNGSLKPLRMEILGGSDYDEHDYAYPIVVVEFPDGHRDACSYRVDGRA